LDEALTAKIKQALRKNASPHHVPDEIIAVKEIPLTLTGKKTEVPVKKLLMGVPVEKAVSMDALSNPEAIAYFITFAQKGRASREASQSEG
jgi:acetoacetyl-CoA synthetase